MTSNKVRDQLKRLSIGLPTGSRREHLEDAEQRTVIQLCQLHEYRWPELKLIFHPANGKRRDKRTAAILFGLGVKRGVPDLWLPVARRGWFGLVIEMKRVDGGRVEPEQKDWIEKLEDNRYYATVCNGADRAWSIIKWYLEGEPTVNGMSKLLEFP